MKTSPSKGLGLQKFCCEQELKDKARTYREYRQKVHLRPLAYSPEMKANPYIVLHNDVWGPMVMLLLVTRIPYHPAQYWVSCPPCWNQM